MTSNAASPCDPEFTWEIGPAAACFALTNAGDAATATVASATMEADSCAREPGRGAIHVRVGDIVEGAKVPRFVKLDPTPSDLSRKPVGFPWIDSHHEQFKNHKMTAWKTIQGDLKKAGANVVDQEVVVDRNLVTSRQPSDIPAFITESLKLLEHVPARR